MASAAGALGVLAHGLGRDFREHARAAAPTLLEKGAQADSAVLDAVEQTLRGFVDAGCLTPAEVLDASASALSAPSPDVRLTALTWLGGAAAAPSFTQADAKACARVVLPLTDDSSTETALADKYPQLRLFTVGQKTASATPLGDLQTVEQPWAVASHTGGAHS